MKKLLLIRHAKAVSELATSDFERPLKHSGIKDATFMAVRLKNHNYHPQLLITSPAIRTEATADIFTEHLGIPKAKEDKRIYSAGLKTLLEVINELPNEQNFIGLVGHNPGMEQILHYLTGSMSSVPTCAVAIIDFELDDWSMISENTGYLAWYSTPKETIEY
jgi:phosphohistidine phosphatase